MPILVELDNKETSALVGSSMGRAMPCPPLPPSSPPPPSLLPPPLAQKPQFASSMLLRRQFGSMPLKSFARDVQPHSTALCSSMAHHTSDLDAFDSDDDGVDEVLVMDRVPPALSSSSARLPPPPPLPIPPAGSPELASPTLLRELFPYLYVTSRSRLPPLTNIRRHHCR
jgi:hypothetical protein